MAIEQNSLIDGSGCTFAFQNNQAFQQKMFEDTPVLTYHMYRFDIR